MSLSYNPTANTITVSIIKARNLKAMDIGGTSGIDASSSPRVILLLPIIILLSSKIKQKNVVVHH